MSLLTTRGKVVFTILIIALGIAGAYRWGWHKALVPKAVPAITHKVQWSTSGMVQENYVPSATPLSLPGDHKAEIGIKDDGTVVWRPMK